MKFGLICFVPGPAGLTYSVPFTDVNFNGPEQFQEVFPYLNPPHSGNGTY